MFVQLQVGHRDFHFAHGIDPVLEMGGGQDVLVGRTRLHVEEYDHGFWPEGRPASKTLLLDLESRKGESNSSLASDLHPYTETCALNSDWSSIRPTPALVHLCRSGDLRGANMG
jgi:hypothetical protein